ncbi:MAG: hypothetical protein ACE5JG_11230 [Planctomycetota bacterium]
MAPLSRRSDRFRQGFLYAGLGAKACFYLLLFWWASRSDRGAAALEGVVWADVITWGVFGVLELPFQPLRVGLGFGFEVFVLVLFFFRGTWFDIATDPVSFGVGVLWFVLFATFRAVLYGAESALQAAGITREAAGSR